MYLGKDNVCAGEGGKRRENSYTKIPWAAVREVFHGGLDPGRALMTAYHYGGSLIIKKKRIRSSSFKQEGLVGGRGNNPGNKSREIADGRIWFRAGRVRGITQR